MNDITVKGSLTLTDIALNPADYPAEVKAAALDVIKKMESQIRDYKSSISQNVISEMRSDNATKILFVDAGGSERTLTLKSAPKKLNADIKDFDQFVVENGFTHSQLGEVKFVPYSWSTMKELRKQGGRIQEVIDKIYVDGSPTIDIK